MKRKLTYPSCLLYCAIMLWMLFDRDRYDPTQTYQSQLLQHLNLIPFRTNWAYIQILLSPESFQQLRHGVICLFGNILTFIPLGLFLPLLWKRFRKFLHTLLAGGTAVICIELLQLFTLTGSCDIDDLVLNLLGITLGYTTYRLLHRTPST